MPTPIALREGFLNTCQEDPSILFQNFQISTGEWWSSFVKISVWFCFWPSLFGWISGNRENAIGWKACAWWNTWVLDLTPVLALCRNLCLTPSFTHGWAQPVLGETPHKLFNPEAMRPLQRGDMLRFQSSSSLVRWLWLPRSSPVWTQFRKREDLKL